MWPFFMVIICLLSKYKLSIFRSQTNLLDSYIDSSMHQFRYFSDLLNHNTSKFVLSHRHLLATMKFKVRPLSWPSSCDNEPCDMPVFISQSESSNSCAQLHSLVGRKFLVSLKNGDVTIMPKNVWARTQRN